MKNKTKVYSFRMNTGLVDMIDNCRRIRPEIPSRAKIVEEAIIEFCNNTQQEAQRDDRD